MTRPELRYLGSNTSTDTCTSAAVIPIALIRLPIPLLLIQDKKFFLVRLLYLLLLLIHIVRNYQVLDALRTVSAGQYPAFVKRHILLEHVHRSIAWTAAHDPSDAMPPSRQYLCLPGKNLLATSTCMPECAPDGCCWILLSTHTSFLDLLLLE